MRRVGSLGRSGVGRVFWLAAVGCVVSAGLVGPGVAGAAAATPPYEVSDANWLNNQTSATGLPCVHTTGTNSCATQPGQIGSLGANSTIEGSLQISTGTSTSLQLLIRCIENGTATNLVTKTLAHTAGANTTYTYLLTVTTTTNCSLFDLAVINVDGNSAHTFTVDTGTSVLVTPSIFGSTPAPTAGPLPTPASPSGPPTAPPVTGTIEDEICVDGVLDVVDADHTMCIYSGTAADEGGAGADTGALCRLGWTLTYWCRVNSAGRMAAPLGPDGGYGLLEQNGAVASVYQPGSLGVQVQFHLVCRDATGAKSCEDFSVSFGVRYWSASGSLVGVLQDGFVVGAAGYGTCNSCTIVQSGYFTIPAGVARVGGWVAVAPSGTGVQDSDDFNHILVVSLKFSFDAGDSFTSGLQHRCQDGSLPQPGPRTDGSGSGICPEDAQGRNPGTGALVCGPISHDCTKPFIGPAGLPVCDAPTTSINPLDWFGWLGCLLTIIPVTVYNVAVVPLINVLIDLLFAGEVMGQEWAAFQLDMSVRFPISWVGPVTTSLSTAFDDIDGGGDLPPTMTVFGQTLSPYEGAGSVTDPLIPYRPIMVSLAWLWFVVFAVKRVGAFLGSGGGTHVSIANAGPG